MIMWESVILRDTCVLLGDRARQSRKRRRGRKEETTGRDTVNRWEAINFGAGMLISFNANLQPRTARAATTTAYRLGTRFPNFFFILLRLYDNALLCYKKVKNCFHQLL